MTPAQIIALIRDVLIVAGVGFLVWRIYSDGENKVKTADLQAVQKQLQNNAQDVARWAQESVNANATRDQQVAQMGAAIAAQRAPVLLCRPPNPSPVPSAPASSTSRAASPGTADAGAGSNPVDVRASVNSFETRIETALADCRAALAQWPQ